VSPAATPRRAKAAPAKRTKSAKTSGPKPPAAAVSAEFQAAYDALRRILAKYETTLSWQPHGASGSWLIGAKMGPYKRPVALAGLSVGKSYVSYHLLPVYMNPELQKKISPELKARMQGKACFNFKRPDPALFKELAALTEAGYQGFKKLGYI
jgi:hypothetical protein